MNTVQGVIACMDNNASYRIVIQPVRSLDLTLDDDLEWEFGIDQSSSCTGLAMKGIIPETKTLKYVILLDVWRDKHLTKTDFYRDLYYLLRKLMSGMKVTMCINEIPVPGKYRNAGDVLRELRGRLHEWVESIPELESALIDEILPQSWKSLIVNKSKGTGRFNVKKEVAADIVDIYPLLRQYWVDYTGDDYDSFDALGILEGYQRYSFAPDGTRLISGPLEKKHDTLVCYHWVKVTDLKTPGYIAGLFGGDFYGMKPELLTYNVRNNFATNARIASTKFDRVMTVVPESELEPLHWKYGIDVTSKEYCMLAFIYRKGALTRAWYNYLTEEIFPWNEVIYGE